MEPAALPDQCCTLPPFKSDYVLVGKHIRIKNGELDVYVTGPAEAQIALVCIYGSYASIASFSQTITSISE
jgi:hypothetical protein